MVWYYLSSNLFKNLFKLAIPVYQNAITVMTVIMLLFFKYELRSNQAEIIVILFIA